jgi:hypothetical protein
MFEVALYIRGERGLFIDKGIAVVTFAYIA